MLEVLHAEVNQVKRAKSDEQVDAPRVQARDDDVRADVGSHAGVAHPRGPDGGDAWGSVFDTQHLLGPEIRERSPQGPECHQVWLRIWLAANGVLLRDYDRDVTGDARRLQALLDLLPARAGDHSQRDPPSRQPHELDGRRRDRRLPLHRQCVQLVTGREDPSAYRRCRRRDSPELQPAHDHLSVGQPQ